MTENFPVFVEGQTLTHTELNELRNFLDTNNHSLGRLVGFGIGCGLEVTLEGDTYTVSPGMAIDQLGRPIVVTEPMTIGVRGPEERFDWMGDARAGQTVVLTLEEVIEDAPDCEEDGCSRHAAPARRTPILRVTPGCVEPTGFSVETSELGGVNPIIVSRRSRPNSTGTVLKTRLLQIMQNHRFSTESIRRLSAINVTRTEIPGSAAYKAGFINQVYFAMIEYLRCAALTGSACFHETETPGVALGCQLDGSWECNFAHHWEPPTGLARSLLGSGCEDPCRFHRARIEALILGFVPLNVPEPDEPPRPTPGGPYQICRHPRYLYGVGGELQLLRDCYHVSMPPLVLPDITVYDPHPDIAFDPALDSYPVDELYGRYKDPIDAGRLGYELSLGHDATMVQAELIDVVRESEGAGFAFDVVVVDEGDVSAMTGYEPAVDAAITDQIVLVANANGMVVETGRVPVNQTLNGVGPAVRDVTEQASVAVEAATGAATGVAGLRGDVETIGQATQDLSIAVLGGNGQTGLTDRFTALEAQTADFGDAIGKGQLDLELAALSATLEAQITEKTSDLEILIASSGRTLRDDFTGMGTAIRAEMAASQDVLRGDFAKGQTEIRAEIAVGESQLRSEYIAGQTEIRAELASTAGQIRTEVSADVRDLRGEFTKGQGEIRADFVKSEGVLRGEIAASEDGLRSEMTTTDAAVRVELDKAQADLRAVFDSGQSELRQEVQSQIKSTGGRIDDVLVGRKLGSVDPRLGIESRTNPHIVGTFRAMAEMMTARIGDGGSSAAKVALAKVERSVTRMEAAAEVGGDIPSIAGPEMLDAFDNLAAVAGELGVSATGMRAVKSSLTKLRRELQA